MPGRHTITTSSDVDQHGNRPYRYGFNGYEKDFEVKNVTGGHLDFGARVYDSRLGRWFSVDPKSGEFPSMSTYSFAANNPIYFIDKDGKNPYAVIIQRLASRGRMLAPYINQGVRTAQLVIMRIGPAASRAIDNYNNNIYAKTFTDKVMNGIADFIIGMGDASLDMPSYVNKHFVEHVEWNHEYDTRIWHSFGDRSIIRESYQEIFGLINNSNVEVHHIIHYDAWKHPVVQHMAQNGFDINNAEMNGIALDKYSPKRGVYGQHSSHPQYNKYVENRLDEMWRNKKQNGTDYTWDDLREDFYDLQEDLLDFIEDAEDDGVSINEYFRDLNNDD